MKPVILFSLRCLLASVCIVGIAGTVLAFPQPGDIFREYKIGYDEAGLQQAGVGVPREKQLRIGGDFDYGGNNIPLGNIDLDGAVRAEAVVEKVQCHSGTYGLAISVNDNEWHEFPPPEGIPSPQAEYQHHAFPAVEIPLSELKASGNVYKHKVGGGTWWPQHLLHGTMIRVYYDSSKPHPAGSITKPAAGGAIQWTATIEAEAGSDNSSVDRVEFLGYYEDFNLKGDGIYRQWQYRWKYMTLEHHLGTAEEAPYTVEWDNQWVPDQEEPMKIAARIVDKAGMIYMTEAVEDLKQYRPEFKVEMCKPYDVPQAWVARETGGSEKFDVEGDLGEATAAQLVVTVWGYENPLVCTFNGGNTVSFDVFLATVNRQDIDPSILKSGENILSAAGGHEHGIEINWPGIVPIIQYGELPEISDVGTRGTARPGAALSGEPFSIGYSPDTRMVAIAVGSAETHTLTIHGVDGRLVVRRNLAGARHYTLSTARCPSGLYIVGLKGAGREMRRTMALSH